MNVTTTLTPARTDLTTATAPEAAPRNPAADAGPDTSATSVRRRGALVIAGALTWAAGLATVGAMPTTSLGVTIGDLSALPFQLGLFALVGAQLRTRATGLSRAARVMLRVEYVLLALATAWTVLHGAVPAFRDDLWLAVLDVFWPLSMIGMFVIGVKIAFAGRWRGAARVWPLLAESWAVVLIPLTGILGPGTVVDAIGAGHLVLGYGGLGVLLMLRPGLTGARA